MINPNFQDRSEPGHQLHLNQRPAIKANAGQRYATDASGAATFAVACQATGAPLQRYLARSDIPCGSAIGPVTAARLGVDTATVGMPMLAIHSVRELCGTEDPSHLVWALAAFLAS